MPRPLTSRPVGDGVLQWSAAEQMPLGCDVPLRRGGRPFARTPRDLVGGDAHIAPQRKALSFRASACREAGALGVHTGVGIHTSPTYFPRLPLPTTKARPGGARSCLFRYRSFMPEYLLLQRENAG